MCVYVCDNAQSRCTFSIRASLMCVCVFVCVHAYVCVCVCVCMCVHGLQICSWQDTRHCSERAKLFSSEQYYWMYMYVYNTRIEFRVHSSVVKNILCARQ